MSLINLFLPETGATSTQGIPPRPMAAEFSGDAQIRDVTSDFWFTLMPDRPTASKVSVTQETAMTYSAVVACTRLLSFVPASLPLNLYRREAGKTESSADDTQFIQYEDLRNTLVDIRPNPQMIGVMAKAAAFQQQVNAGNAFFEIERSNAGKPLALWPIPYHRVTTMIDDETGGIVYEVKSSVSKPLYIPAADMLHFAYPITKDGINGKGLIDRARESIGLGIVAERQGAAQFGSGGFPRIAILHKTKLSPEARTNFRKEWKEIYAGAEGDKVAQVGEGAEIHEFKTDLEKLQFTETRAFNIEEIARWYGVPLHMLQRAVNPGVNNVESLAREFKALSLMPLTVLWEQELNVKLLTEEERKTMYFRFNFDELLRPDSKALSEFIRTLIQIGVLTPDEGRIMVGKNPLGGPAGGLFMQGAMCPIGKLGEQKASQKQLASTEKEKQGTDSQASTIIRDVIERLTTEQARAAQEQATQATAKIESIRESMATVVESLTERIEAMSGQKDTREGAMLNAAQSMLAGSVSRMIRIQATAARRAANKPGEFLAWLDKFYDDDHRKNFTEAVETAVGALSILGVAVCAKALAEREVNRSRDELLKLSGECFSAEELSTKVDARMAEWESKRAADACAAVIGGQAA